jgi:hypothetical protein
MRGRDTLCPKWRTMPEVKSITFRDQTTGRISDLLADEGLVCAQSQNILSYLAGALLNYKEEGVELTPSVVLCSSIQSFLKAFPGGIAYNVGLLPLEPASGPKILKECAPLTNRNWSVFIERTNDHDLTYGVFTYFRLPTAIPLQEGITIDPSQFSVLVRKITTSTIEMRGAKGSVLTLIFSTVRDSSTVAAPIEKFCGACCADFQDAKLAKEFKVYFSRVVEEALTSSHGTMLVCGRNLDLTTIPELQDAVPVTPKLDFATAMAQYHESSSAGSMLALQRSEELLQGFLRCDGIIVFDTCGCIVAYRVFYRPGVGAPQIPTVDGGSRRRAYEGIKSLVGPHLMAVLFHSQDGLTLHHGEAE